MNYKYVLTETIYHNGEHTRSSYGIAVVNTKDNVTLICSIDDITENRYELENLIELCNTEKLEIEHLQNVLEDFLCLRK